MFFLRTQELRAQIFFLLWSLLRLIIYFFFPTSLSRKLNMRFVGTLQFSLKQSISSNSLLGCLNWHPANPTRLCTMKEGRREDEGRRAAQTMGVKPHQLSFWTVFGFYEKKKTPPAALQASGGHIPLWWRTEYRTVALTSAYQLGTWDSTYPSEKSKVVGFQFSKKLEELQRRKGTTYFKDVSLQKLPAAFSHNNTVPPATAVTVGWARVSILA